MRLGLADLLPNDHHSRSGYGGAVTGRGLWICAPPRFIELIIAPHCNRLPAQQHVIAGSAMQAGLRRQPPRVEGIKGLPCLNG